MSDNLERQLDEVTSYINEYWSFALMFRSQILRNFFKATRLLLKSRNEKSQELDILSGRLIDRYKPIYHSIASAEQRETIQYQAFLSDYPRDAIGNNVENRFPNANFEKLKKLHEVKKARILNFNLKQYVGLVLGAATLTLKTIPKKVVESDIGILYEDFEVYIFWLTVGILAYLLIVLIPAWRRFRKYNEKHRFIGEVLEYISLRMSEKTPG